MARGKSRDELKQEWEHTRKDWFSIYNWSSLAIAAYSQEIAKLLVQDFDRIVLDYKNLRQRNFKLANHRGQCALQTSIEQFTEKRFVRALFNLDEVVPFGKILDYEIPLKSSKSAQHGDIDLLGLKPSGLLVVEAKRPSSSESLLKAMLQAFTYTCLVHASKEIFTQEYGLESRISLVPALITFVSASSGKQLMTLELYPDIQNLMKLLNDDLARLGESKLEFYLSEEHEAGLNGYLQAQPFDARSERICFRDGFVPRFHEVIV